MIGIEVILEDWKVKIGERVFKYMLENFFCEWGEVKMYGGLGEFVVRLVK